MELYIYTILDPLNRNLYHIGEIILAGARAD